MPDLLVSSLAVAHAREQLKLERDEIRRLLAAYEQQRLALRGQLADEEREGAFLPVSYRGVLGHVEAAILLLVASLLNVGTAGVRAVADLGIAQTLREIADLERRFGADITFEPLREAAARRLDTGILLDRVDGSLRSYGSTLTADIRRRLGVHMAMQSPWPKMTADIAGRLEQHAVQGARWKAERIVRTEIGHALNAARQAAIEAAAEQIPGLMRQWDATLEGACPICRTLHGQVRRLHEPWHAGGRVIMQPPDPHPNCRCQLIAWREVWVRVAA